MPSFINEAHAKSHLSSLVILTTSIGSVTEPIWFIFSNRAMRTAFSMASFNFLGFVRRSSSRTICQTFSAVKVVVLSQSSWSNEFSTAMIGSWRRNSCSAPTFQHLSFLGNHHRSGSRSCILSLMRDSEAATFIPINTLPKQSGRHHHPVKSSHQNREVNNLAQRHLIPAMSRSEHSTESPTSDSALNPPPPTKWYAHLPTILVHKELQPLVWVSSLWVEW